MMRRTIIALGLGLALAACGKKDAAPQTPAPAPFDLIIKGGAIYDGEGGAPFTGDVGVTGDRIAAVGDLSGAEAKETVDAAGMAVAPGFINMLSWATEPLIEDGRAVSDIRQGVTLEVMGEGWSMGPLNDAMKAQSLKQQSDVKYDIAWTTLGEYLEFLEAKGVSPNIASYVGATSIRVHEIGYEDRPPTEEELTRMKELVRAAMREGALGVGSSLIYAPAFYAGTDELTALVAAAAEFGGGYISHVRSEGDRYLEALDELISIARAAKTHAQVYHLKPAGQANWGKSEEGLARLDAARAEGLDITANIYTYTAGATGLDAAMPPWVQEGGHDKWIENLKDPAIRARVLAEMRAPAQGWESLYQLTGYDPTKVLLIAFKNPALKPLTGKSLAEVATMRGQSPEDAMIDLVIEDDSRVGTAYFLMSEDNIRRNIAWPHTMFGSDEGAYAPEGVFMLSNPHPRAYGTFARLFAKYVREEKVISVAEAVRRLTSLPADAIRIKERGRLKAGHFADIVVFNPDAVQDHATFAQPHQFATGVRDVWVNGVQVLKNEEHTGATPGRVVRGPGWTGE
ncbi:MAG: D-aminoacylase [Parvularculaceae bacterium]|nr:D-aminoacylase [Parvularculaceae bacterium]